MDYDKIFQASIDAMTINPALCQRGVAVNGNTGFSVLYAEIPALALRVERREGGVYVSSRGLRSPYPHIEIEFAARDGRDESLLLSENPGYEAMAFDQFQVVTGFLAAVIERLAV